MSPSPPPQAVAGVLSVVDLAGSERVKKTGAEGKRFTEATAINTSLLALGNVVQALAVKKKHAPFRDSVLTKLLMASLAGNCKTVLLCCISPSDTSLSETSSSLEFAARAQAIAIDPKIHALMMDSRRKKKGSSTLGTQTSFGAALSVVFTTLCCCCCRGAVEPED